MKRFVISLAIFTLLPASVFADQVVNLPYNYQFNGSITIPSLAALQCMATDANKKVVSSGAPCGGGGGGVSSVTSANNLLLSAPTTGAVVLTPNETPTYTGAVNAPAFAVNSVEEDFFSWIDANSAPASMIADGSNNVAGVFNRAFGLVDNATPLASMNVSGSLGIAGHYASAVLASGVGDCLNIGSNGTVADSGSPCAAGGGVTSVTAGPSGNLTFAPTTGAVIGDTVSIPTFGAVQSSVSPGFGFYTTVNDSPRSYAAASSILGSGNSDMGPNPSATVAGVLGDVWTFSNWMGSVHNADFMTIGSTGDIGVSRSVHTGATLTPGFVSTGTQFAQWQASTADIIQQLANGAFAVQGIPNSAFGITDPTNTLNLMSLTTGGDVGFRLGVHADNAVLANLIPGQCLEASGSNQIISTGSPCGGATPQIQHGSQTIAAVAGSCINGTTVTFSPSFSVAPDITLSTSATVGDTGTWSGPITTSSFTPAVCSTTNSGSVTVSWIAVN
jgi:hypothetical protein